MREACGRIRATLLCLGVILAALAPLAVAQQVHRNRFEGHAAVWLKGNANVAFDELVHNMTDQGAHDGQRCEHLRINCNQQNAPGQEPPFVHYTYAIGKAPINEELSASLWVKANRPGVQIVARVVLPNDRDPTSLDQRLTTLVRGDLYRVAGRWQRLEIGRPVALAKQQQQLMQAQLKRPVNFDGAYIDTLMLNVYAGVGATEVWIDDLEVGPLADALPAPRIAADPNKTGSRLTGIAPEVDFNGANLLIGGKKHFIRGIKLTDTPPASLRNAGFNTLFVESTTDPALLRKAVQEGFWLVPGLQATGDNPQLMSAEGVTQELRNFPERDAVLFWYLGTALAYEQTAQVARSAQLVHLADRQRQVGGDAWDGLARYSSSLNLLGVHRWPLMTTMELPHYREWLEQRSRLANPGTFLWTWVQTHTPEWYSQLLYDQPSAQEFKTPIGPQPEQIRLLAYTALGSGCRGLAFWSDRFLADSHHGRDRLLCLALINKEIEMLEPLLVGLDSPPQWVGTSSPDVQAAVLRTSRGILVLPVWQGKGAQFVPGQGAVAKLTLVVPQVPQSFQAWEVLPGEVRALRTERVPGGTRINLPEFGLTSSIVFTGDMNLIIQFQDQCRAMQKDAAQFTIEMAQFELAKIRVIQDALEKAGQAVPDAASLLKDAEQRLATAKQDWDGRLYADSYREAQRALRPLLILMRAQWDAAVKNLDAPVSSPYAVSYFTLPRHVEFMQQVKKLTASMNVLQGGDFETLQEMRQLQWSPQDTTLDDVLMSAQRVAEVNTPRGPKGEPSKKEGPREGRQCLRLEIKPKATDVPPPKALDRTFLAINSPTVKLPVGSLVKISGWVMIPEAIAASTDGALFYDSAGGEPLALRLRGPMGWQHFTLYRRVPASGNISVTLALTGLGTAYFDDVRIEPLGVGN